MSSNDFLPGDTIGILPENNDEDVQLILNAMNLQDKADTIMKISLSVDNKKKTAKIPSYIPISSTPRIILKQCLNIHSIPKKLFLRSLVEYTNNESEKEFFKILCSKEGSELYTKMITEENLTFIKLLKMYPSCQPDFRLLLENLPRLLPRSYSIANSPFESNNEIKIIFSILNENPGITTDYLQKLVNKFLKNSLINKQSLFLNCYLREHNNFRYTEDDIMKNVIMISVGCGISPFLGFLEHKKKFYTNKKYSLQQLNDMWLISGYRYRKCSLYTDEINNYLKQGILTEYFESFSREYKTKYKYVQDHILENAEKFVNMIFKNDSVIYICADGAGISKDIQESIQQAIVITLQCSNEETKEIIENLKKENRYREDIWI